MGQTPPPYHGQAVVTAMLFDHRWEDLRVELLRMAYSDSIGAVGKVSLGKVFHLLGLVLKTWKIALLRRPAILYYLPASANRAPVARDVIYLALVRWCFRKKIFHYHAGGLPEYVESAGWLGALARRVYRGADLSIEICPTEHSPGESFAAKRTVIVPNGLDVTRLPRQRPAGVPRALFIGSLSEGKGVLELIRTAGVLRRRGCAIQFQVVGGWSSPEFEAEVEALVQSERVGEMVNFTGVLAGDAKWQQYADADFFFFPSHYGAENFPLVLIEALAYGLPIVSTRWRGIPQLVGDRGAATLCEVKSPDQFADALEALCADEGGVRGRMATAAVETYLGRFTEEKFVEAMARCFRELRDA